jgi:hypothetical protein
MSTPGESATPRPEDWRLWGDYTRGQEPRRIRDLLSLWRHGFEAGRSATTQPEPAPLGVRTPDEIARETSKTMWPQLHRERSTQPEPAATPLDLMREALDVALTHHWEHDRNCGIDALQPGANPCNCGVERDREMAFEALATTPSELDPERLLAAVDSMKVSRDTRLIPDIDWISVGVVRSIIQGTHPILTDSAAPFSEDER